jgi:hypothetical protein
MEGLDARSGRRQGHAQFRRHRLFGRGEFRPGHREVVQPNAIEFLRDLAQRAIAMPADAVEQHGHAGAYFGGDGLRGTHQGCSAPGLVDGIPVEAFHASILSTGTTISPRAPACRRSSRRCQVITP